MTQTTDRAYEWTKGQLLDGQFVGGELISEGQIAEELGVSRTPVREAFLRLQAEGFLELYPKRGAIVVPVGLGEARAVGEARLMVEDFALAAVAARGAAALSKLGADLLKRLDADSESQLAGLGFHEKLVAAAGNPLIADMFRNLCDRHLRLVAAAVGTYGPDGDAEEHRELAELIAAGRVDEAATALRRHLAALFGVAPARPRDLV
ncbi:GntR family transcriptional regulator [Nocardia uniformis]|uniref:GntR family transcriptional regulator n=1 Tax=Nocardia uniformis TaxID=53432 RepID=A0A849CJK5_9NOCA|nr:GntR family transcriptional regulator [Nocardia uniformis]NNH74681.1 GntR family transcriptional regulator [Nocardia uniformis]